MKLEGLVLNDRSTTGEFQFLAVKFPFVLVRMCGCQYREHQKIQKTLKNRETKQKPQITFTRTHDTVVEKYFESRKNTKPEKTQNTKITET